MTRERAKELKVKISGQNWTTYFNLLEQYTFLDGSPCGKVVE